MLKVLVYGYLKTINYIIMFIEKKDSWLFLAKKVAWKKILVKIVWEIITSESITQLTKKECAFIYSLDSYKNFSTEIYNEDLLQGVVYQSMLLSNAGNVWNIEDKKLSYDENVMKNIISIWWWSDLDFPKKFIYNSNHIEGSKIPEEEVEKIIENKRYRYKVKNEIQEVENSIKSWNFIKEKFLFNEANIKKLYHILTKNLLQETGEKYPRWFKKVVNVVNNSITTAPENVSWEINSLIQFYKENKKNIFPLQSAFDFHLKYEQIHPFENGNGRTGRFIMNKILLQNTFFPMIVFRENKQAYFHAIASCKSGNKKKYYKFMLEQYKKTLDQI